MTTSWWAAGRPAAWWLRGFRKTRTSRCCCWEAGPGLPGVRASARRPEAGLQRVALGLRARIAGTCGGNRQRHPDRADDYPPGQGHRRLQRHQRAGHLPGRCPRTTTTGASWGNDEWAFTECLPLLPQDGERLGTIPATTSTATKGRCPFAASRRRIGSPYPPPSTMACVGVGFPEDPDQNSPDSNGIGVRPPEQH